MRLHKIYSSIIPSAQFALWLIATVCLGQTQAECDYWTLRVEKSAHKIIYQSKTPLLFHVSEKVDAELTLANSGELNTLSAEIIFREQSGYFVDLGSMLSLYFSDDSRVDIIATQVKSFPSSALFTLLKPSGKGTKKIMTYEDQLFYNKLTSVNLRSLGYTVAYKKRIIPVSEANAELIKIMVRCLVRTPF